MWQSQWQRAGVPLVSWRCPAAPPDNIPVPFGLGVSVPAPLSPGWREGGDAHPCAPAVCHHHGLCYHRVPRPVPCPWPCATAALSLRLFPGTVPAQSALVRARHRLRFVSPTQRGCAGRGLQLPTGGSGAALPVPRSSPGIPLSQPHSWVPLSAGGPRGAARTDTEGADVAELGKEPLVPERPAGTPTHGPAQETPRVPAEEQGGIPIPSAGLLQVTERRREWSPRLGSLPVPASSCCA